MHIIFKLIFFLFKRQCCNWNYIFRRRTWSKPIEGSHLLRLIIRITLFLFFLFFNPLNMSYSAHSSRFFLLTDRILFFYYLFFFKSSHRVTAKDTIGNRKRVFLIFFILFNIHVHWVESFLFEKKNFEKCQYLFSKLFLCTNSDFNLFNAQEKWTMMFYFLN